MTPATGRRARALLPAFLPLLAAAIAGICSFTGPADLGRAVGSGLVASASAATPSVTPKTQAPNEARALSHAFSNVAKALGPSVVRIEVEVGGPRVADRRGRRAPMPDDEDGNVPPFFRHFFEFGPNGGGGGGMPSPGPSLGVGSGFIIDSAGNIVTNRHVVERATKVTVTMNDGKEYGAKVVGKDAQTDVAVVRLEKPPSNLVVARLGDSDKLEVGEWVVAVGSPLGLEQTVTAGIISGKGRPGKHVRMSGRRVRGYIQTDAKINPGNSGGPLVNLEGEVVGVNTLIQVGAGGAYGFAIPVNEVRRVAQLLIKEGRVRYPYVGLLLTDVRDLDETQKAKAGKALPAAGAFVAELTPGGPAAKSGIRPGDVVTSINNKKVESSSDVVDFVSSQPIGSAVTIQYLRDGKPSQVQVMLGELPDEDARQAAAGQGQQGKVGLGLQTLTPDVASSLGMDKGTRGAVVTDILPGSPAERAGLKPGDVIVEVDRKPVASADQAVAALGESPKGGPAAGHLLRVRSGNGTRFVTVK